MSMNVSDAPETSSTTRPVSVGHRAPKRNGDVQRYTIDLDRDLRKTLALAAADWEVDKSKIVRTLLYLFEADVQLRNRVKEEIFTEEADSE